MNSHLLPEEDAIDELDDDADEADPTLPGDLWFHANRAGAANGASYTSPRLACRRRDA